MTQSMMCSLQADCKQKDTHTHIYLYVYIMYIYIYLIYVYIMYIYIYHYYCYYYYYHYCIYITGFKSAYYPLYDFPHVQPIMQPHMLNGRSRWPWPLPLGQFFFENLGLPPGKHTKNYGKSLLFMGKTDYK